MGNYMHKWVQRGKYSLEHCVITNNYKRRVLTANARISTCAFIRGKQKKWVPFYLPDVKTYTKNVQVGSKCHDSGPHLNEPSRGDLDCNTNERLGENRTRIGDDAVESTEHARCDDNVGRSGDLLQSSDFRCRVGNGNGVRVTKDAGKRNRSRRFEDIVSPSGTDLLYGISPCLLALEVNRRQVNKVYVTSSFRESASPAARTIMQKVQDKHLGSFIREVHRKDLDKLSKGRPHQGICLETSRIHFQPLTEDSTVNDQELLQEPLVYLAMDQMLDPMNMGAIIRSAYYLGVDKIITGKHNCCSLTPVVSKASSGTMEIMPVYATSSLLSFLVNLRDNGWEIVGSTCDSNNRKASSAASFKLSKPTVLVIGGEGSGLPDSIENACCRLLTIRAGRELHTGVDSLNVSVATGILLQSLLLQRRFPQGH